MNSIKEIMTNGDLWTALGGLSMIGLAICLWLPLAKNQGLHRRYLSLCLAGILGGAAGLFAFAPHLQDAVVRYDGTPVLLSPFKSAETQSTLDLGDRVRVVKQHENYTYIRTMAGKQGWVAEDQLERFVQL